MEELELLLESCRSDFTKQQYAYRMQKYFDFVGKLPKTKDPSYIYLDEDNQIKVIPLSKLDSSASVYISRTMNYKNPAKLIHDLIFG